MRFKPDRGLYPFDSRWLTLSDGTVIHYLDEPEAICKAIEIWHSTAPSLRSAPS